jgi:DHA3 family macrolide efflux protein-like MFS transporter
VRGLFNRNFILLWQGQTVSRLGDQAFALAMAFWVVEKTGSASLMGLLLSAGALPTVLLGPVGGVAADRFPRMRVIIACNLLGGAAMLGLSLVMLRGQASNDLTVALLFLVTVVLGVVRAFFQPALGAALPDLVSAEQLAAANSLNLFSLQGANLLGQAVGGILYRWVGAPLLFLADGVSFVFAAGSGSLVKVVEHGRGTATEHRRGWASFLADLRAGLAYVWQKRGLLGFALAGAGYNFFIMPVLVLLPFYVHLYLKAGPEWYGFLLAGFSAGSIFGFLVAGAWKLSAAARGWSAMAMMLLAPFPVAAIGFIRSPVAALACAMVLGAMLGILNVNVITTIQATTPAEMRGRVLGLNTTFTSALMPLGMAAGGIAGDLTAKNVPLIYLSCGVLSFCFTALTISRRSTLEFLGHG